MKIAHTTTDVVTKITNGMTGDFSDFAIARPGMRGSAILRVADCEAADCLAWRIEPRAARLAILTESDAARTASCLRDGHHVLELFGFANVAQKAHNGGLSSCPHPTKLPKQELRC